MFFNNKTHFFLLSTETKNLGSSSPLKSRFFCVYGFFSAKIKSELLNVYRNH